MTHFEFSTAAHIFFGWGSASHLAPAAAKMGSRALVVTGSSPARIQPLLDTMQAAGLSWAPLINPSEPTVELVREGVKYAREQDCNLIVAIGGGSVLDAGKAIAALLSNPGDAVDYLEVVGRAQPLPKPAVPMIAVPTTAGSGAEVTRNAVLACRALRVKASLRSPYLLPKLALVDPELTLHLPRRITAFTGFDALTQVIEPYVSCRATSLTDLYCVEGMRRASAALPAAWENGEDREARTSMGMASLLGGLALANAGLGVVHAFAAPIGGMFPAPHGAICAAVLPHAIAVNMEALQRRGTGDDAGRRALQRYDEAARLLTGKPQAAAGDAVSWIRDLCSRLQIPSLRAYGVTAADIPGLAEKAALTSSMKSNPIPLTGDELREIASRAL